MRATGGFGPPPSKGWDIPQARKNVNCLGCGPHGIFISFLAFDLAFSFAVAVPVTTLVHLSNDLITEISC